MSLLDEDQRKILLGVAIGAVAAGLVRSIYPVFTGLGRPIAKAAIKSGIALYEKGRERAAQLGEVFEDVVAEAKAELEAEARGAATEAPAAEPGSVS